MSSTIRPTTTPTATRQPVTLTSGGDLDLDPVTPAQFGVDFDEEFDDEDEEDDDDGDLSPSTPDLQPLTYDFRSLPVDLRPILTSNH